MKRLIFSLFFICLSFTILAQTQFLKGIKVGKTPSGTSVITVDSITQYSTGDIKFWKGGVQLNPNLKAGFKIGTSAVPSTLTATELGYSDGVTGPIQVQLDTKIDTTGGNWEYASSIMYTKAQTLAKIDSLISIRVPNFTWTANNFTYSYKKDSVSIATTLKNGLISFYGFEETSGTTAVDSKSALNGTINGTVTVNQTGVLGGKSYLFSGASGAYVSIPHNAAQNIASGDIATKSFAFSFWISVPSTDNECWIIQKLYDCEWGLKINTGYPQPLFVDRTMGSINAVSPISANSFHHILVNFNSGTLTLYIDNVLNTTGTVSGTASASTNTLNIGSADGGGWFIGNIDDVAFWNRSLTPTEIGLTNTLPYSLW